MLSRLFAALGAALLFGSVAAHAQAASCPNAITTLTVQPGGPFVPLSVRDQNCNLVSPANLSWTGPAGLALTANLAGTAYNASAPASAQYASGTLTFTFTGTGGVVQSIAVEIGTPPSSLTVTSP